MYSEAIAATLEVLRTHLVSMPSPNPFGRISELAPTVAEEQRVRVDLSEATGRHVRVVCAGDRCSEAGKVVHAQ